MTANYSIDQVVSHYQKLLQERPVLGLASCNQQGEAEASDAPYAGDEQGLYILVSHLAAHTRNLLARGQCGVAIAQPETACANVFVRQRLFFRCEVRQVKREEALYEQHIEQMRHKLGDTVTLLQSLPDFRLLQLMPTQGRFILGFGQAFSIDVAAQTFIPIKP